MWLVLLGLLEQLLHVFLRDFALLNLLFFLGFHLSNHDLLLLLVLDLSLPSVLQLRAASLQFSPLSLLLLLKHQRQRSVVLLQLRQQRRLLQSSVNFLIQTELCLLDLLLALLSVLPCHISRVHLTRVRDRHALFIEAYATLRQDTVVALRLTRLLLETNVGLRSNNLLLVLLDDVVFLDVFDIIASLLLDLLFNLLLAFGETLTEFGFLGTLLLFGHVDDVIAICFVHESLQLILELFLAMTTHVLLLDFSLLLVDR